MITIQYIAIFGNKSIGPCRDTEDEAKADANSIDGAVAISVSDYIQQLESALRAVEDLYTAQKAHMKQLWKDSPPGQIK